MRTSAALRSVALLVLLTVAACGGSNGPAGAGGGSSGSSGGAGSGGLAGATGGTAAGGSAGSPDGRGGGGAGATGGAGTAGAGGGSAGEGGAAAATGGATAGAGGAMAGAGGAAGAAGTPAGGNAGATGGTAGHGAGGAGGASPLKLEYASTSSTATAFNVRLTVLGPTTPNIGAIKLRYYFTDDSGQGTVNPVVDLARWTIASTGTAIDLRATGGCSVNWSTRKLPATSSADVGCGLASPTGVGDVIELAVHFDPAQSPANDYSFIDTSGALVANDHMLVTVNGVVVAGTPAP